MKNNKIDKLKKEMIELALYRIENYTSADQLITYNGIEIYLTPTILVNRILGRKINFGDFFTIEQRYEKEYCEEKETVFYHNKACIKDSQSKIDYKGLREWRNAKYGEAIAILEEAIEAFSKDEVVK